MASDSREEWALSLSLPADLDEWLDERALAHGVDREELLVQVLAAYRATDELDDEFADPIEAAVDERLDAATADIEARIEDRLESRLEDRLEDRLESRLEDRLEERIDALEGTFQEKVVDVRERVIQVKKEADAKAPREHTHEELEEVETLSTVVAALEESLDDLEAAVDDLEASHEAAIDDLRADLEDDLETAAAERADIDDRLTDATDKLRRVAWVVSDLKDEVGADDAHENAVTRIKRAAAQEGVSTATCDNCGESVEIALLTAPECPHCEATVSDVRPSGGIFRKKARLVAAAQLEAGEEGDAK